ncbi:glutamine--scyllo-inositol aminotransferase (plasmid) [Bryobacterales bacterium F-183]|nr:glutamine--scyllo-inositol aminotransferase [Bryobacterales bacterium F-183]
MSNTPIPFLDLVTPHVELQAELTAVFQKAITTGGFIGGPMVTGFEEAFAKYCDAKHCVGVGSGTDALRFAFMAGGIGAGDIIVTVPHTFIATTEAISQCGARPVFVDIEEKTCTMDVAKLQAFLETKCEYQAESRQLIHTATGERVAGIVPVHIYGQMADMDPIMELAERFNLMVVEDACQAHGATYFSKRDNRWRTAGSMGHAGAFSFYPGKNLGACGEAGATVTNDDKLAAGMKMIRDHGQKQKYYHSIEGYNGRLDAIQAGILGVKLEKMPEWTKQRQDAAARYETLLADSGARLPQVAEGRTAVWHLYVVRVADRDGLMKALGAVGIGTGIHYPIPLHLQEAYKGMGYQEGDFPVTERVAREIVSLPMFPQLRAEQQERVAVEVKKFVLAGAAPAAAAAN